MADLEHQIHKALVLLDRCDTVNRADLSIVGIGMKTINCLIESEWATLAYSMTRQPLYSITDTGRVRAKLKPVKKLSSRPKLKMLEPRLKTLPPRMKTLR